MTNSATLKVEEGIALITLDFPPVNAMSPALISGLYDTLNTALADPSVEAVVMNCAGRTFIAGADLKSMGKGERKVTFFDVQDVLENAEKPTVVAMHGTALGGGLEIALTFHFRIAAPSTRLGLPEVKLGLLPGGGGTQRFTRLVGAERAAEPLLSGRHMEAAEALSIGLLDRIAREDHLVEDAVAFARELANAGQGPRRISEFEDRVAADRADSSLFDRLHSTHANKIAHLDAPKAIFRCIEAAVKGPWETGLAIEREAFQPLMTGPQSAALRYLFMAERASLKTPPLPDGIVPRVFEAVGIVGTSQTAIEIAVAVLNAADSTVIIAQSGGTEAVSQIRRILLDHAGQDEGAIREAERKLSTLTCADDGAGLDLMIDTTGAQFAFSGSQDAVVASSTASANPGSRLAMHFYAAGHVTRLTEVMRSQTSDPAALSGMMAFAKKLKVPSFMSSPADDFIGIRMLAVLRERERKLIDAGLDAADIDRVLAEFGFNTGPFVSARALVAETTRQASPAVSPAGLTDDMILQHLLYPVINEGAKVLEERLAARPSDIDLLWTSGFGWPAHTGGPMHHADAVGISNIVEVLSVMDDCAPCPLLVDLAGKGESLSSQTF